MLIPIYNKYTRKAQTGNATPNTLNSHIKHAHSQTNTHTLSIIHLLVRKPS